MNQHLTDVDFHISPPSHSISLKTFPEKCRKAKLKPLFKKGCTETKNYRPFSHYFILFSTSACRYPQFPQNFMMFPLSQNQLLPVGIAVFLQVNAFPAKKYIIVYDIIQQIFVPVESSDLMWCKNNLHYPENIIYST